MAEEKGVSQQDIEKLAEDGQFEPVKKADLEAMTKNDLLALAEERLPDLSLDKSKKVDEIRAALWLGLQEAGQAEKSQTKIVTTSTPESDPEPDEEPQVDPEATPEQEPEAAKAKPEPVKVTALKRAGLLTTSVAGTAAERRQQGLLTTQDLTKPKG